MSSTSREIVTRCLEFDHPERLPRELWALPWAIEHYGEAFQAFCRRFPGDFGAPPDIFRPSPRRKGDWFAEGTYVDEWGCLFTNIQRGVFGEARTALLENLADWKRIRPPYEILPDHPGQAREAVNRACAASSLFMRAPCGPRPWERYQFIRTTEKALLDVMEPDEAVLGLLRVIHEYYLKELEFWVGTDVDGIMFMDDWGSQWQLLIPPPVWRRLFKPLYRDYCDLAHAHGKFAFMHSDGHIAEIYDDLIEVGVDAVNSQLFCMDMADLARRAKGQITFWGEIDRQHVLPSPDPQVGRDAVRRVAKHLYDPAGGIVAQFELGAGASLATAEALFEEWDAVHAEARKKEGRG
jgi:hypothetical protein